MEDFEFRELRADELEVRVAREVGQNKDKVELLVYKDSRCDMRILDETVGKKNWSVKYQREGETLLGGIGIYVQEHNAFIFKWAAGAESNIEAIKGEQSDALKRAGFVWGIGRSLYSAPRIIVKGTKYDSFKVTRIDYENGAISSLEIENSAGDVVFLYENFEVKKIEEKKIDKGELLRSVCSELKAEEPEYKNELKRFYYYYIDKVLEWDFLSEKIVRKKWDAWKERV